MGLYFENYTEPKHLVIMEDDEWNFYYLDSDPINDHCVIGINERMVND